MARPEQITPEVLIAIRYGLSMSQTELGDALSYGQSQISCYERGVRPIPRRTQLAILALAQLANIDVDALVGPEEDAA